MVKLQTFPTQAAWLKAATEHIVQVLKSALSIHPTVRIALSGGSTPEPVYEALSKRTDINWSKVEVFMVDERYISATDSRSNAKLIRDTLVSKVSAEFFPIDTSVSIESSVSKYEELLRSKENPLFHLVILGLGTDGHTASLFPKSPALSEQSTLVAHTQTKTHEVADRITLTFPAILNSEQIVILVRGKNKKPIVNELMRKQKPTNDFPVGKLSKHKNLLVMYAEP